MTTTLAIQIIVYMVILGFMAFAWGYSKGHRDGMLMGRIQARKLARMAKESN